jgi:hypothetical protein
VNYTRPGFIILVVVIFGVLIPVIAIDAILSTRTKWRPVGFYLNQFTLAYPWFAAIIALIFGMMVAHFFLNIADA